ncbi:MULTISPECIES: PAS domain-containing response regulator [Pseudanabaena]|uniref:PAS domain S-box protein n=2 Tax=Pseudanabaena TaxID=1152 RepID=A0A9X4MCS3_9CYAN|nr:MULTISPECIES: response regulator [Pseudanabaena]ELS30784.1 putative PAS/PAC sensor protein [Pseudanabaena biceps PCC 7429]MDG3496952.1 PAS domain S-box protein [Pseudanabaena catenata USMAC16]
MISLSPNNSAQTKILLVENDPIDQLAFTRYVKRSGLSYDYTIASSLSEALNILNHQSFEVAILDYNLGDGFSNELFPLLREINCPFIISTGSGDEEIAATLMNEGASDYLIKDPERNYLKVLPVTVSKTLARQKSEQQLRLLSHAMEQVKDSAYIIDEEGKLLFVNEALRSLCNLGRENLIGQSIESLGQPQLIEQILPVNSPPLLPVEYDWFSDSEISITKRDGSEASMLLSQSFIEDGTRRIRVGLMHDITLIKQVELSLLLTQENLERRVQERTAKLQAANQSLELEIQERKQAEALLKASEKRYATLAAAAPVGIFHTDPVGKCTYVNECWGVVA